MYLDPGFGSMLIQAVVAVIAAGGAYLLLFRKNIQNFFKKKRGAEAKRDDGDAKP